MATQQDQLNADVAAIKAVFDKISGDVSAINSGIAALKTQVGNGTPVDLSQLDALAAQGASVQAAADAAVAALPAATDSGSGDAGDGSGAQTPQ